MQHKKYPKIYRLGKEETEGILLGTVFVQEKIDGANTQIWLDEESVLHMGSRSNEIFSGFNGFCAYVTANEPIRKLLENNPKYRLYGEWLVRHTVSYNEMSYRKFYLYDIECEDKFLDLPLVQMAAESYGIPFPQIFDTFTNPTEDMLKKFVGKTNLGEVGEGIVLKNPDFVNKFGEHQYAKMVDGKFMEENALMFGGNNKHSDTYWEMWIVNKYMTLERIEKIMHKIQPTIDKKLDLEHTPRISGAAYHDMMTEEVWDIAKKVGTVDFKALNHLATRKATQIYKDLITGNISVADRDNT